MTTSTNQRKLRIAFVHPDLGIGGAERLVVDAALGLQKLGHSVDIYTSYHDPKHCFEETRDGTLSVHAPRPPFPRSFKGKFHILFANAHQLHLMTHLLRPGAPKYDVYFVDQLSTCSPTPNDWQDTRRILLPFPGQAPADGAYVEGKISVRGPSEEHVPIPSVDSTDADIRQVTSERPTLLSLNRFEKKKNAALAIDAFALLLRKLPDDSPLKNARLVLAGGYDPRLEDNMMAFVHLIDRAKANSLSYNIVKPSTSSVNIPPFNTTEENPSILFLLNFTTPQRSALLSAPSTLALLYTPTNEHFGIGPVEAMVCGVPVLACNSGGPTESVIDAEEGRTGWLREPDPEVWADTLLTVVNLSADERKALGERAKQRARNSLGWRLWRQVSRTLYSVQLIWGR
ncbi:hypothetical protein BC629DRAFT_1587996 [Irpex lacteus]|nr:hypothetical protein BC629DRAFT_1587996 [Irpex lacteus]